MTQLVTGKRVHFAGSADPNIESSKLSYAHNVVKHLSKQILLNGGGLVTTIGADPVHSDNHSLSIIFDWTMLEALYESQESNLLKWPIFQEAPVVAVGLPNWQEKIPKRRQSLWERITEKENLQLKKVPSELRVGGILREIQSEYGDILVTLGGGPGVYHLSRLYISKRRPVIPLDLSLKKDKMAASEELNIKAIENPDTFFECKKTKDAVRAFSRLSLKKELMNLGKFEKRFFYFISLLNKPKAFYVRLLNSKLMHFKLVEDFFRNVVDDVIKSSGYERFESGTDVSKEAFLNVEIFKNLHDSSLVIVDMTGKRHNCCIELGFALGESKKTLITAKEGTKLPFDTKMMPCHFWSPDEDNNIRREKFRQFIEKNIIRMPIIT